MTEYHIYSFSQDGISHIFPTSQWTVMCFQYGVVECHVFSYFLLHSGRMSWWVVVKVMCSFKQLMAQHMVSTSRGVDTRHDCVMLLLSHYSRWTGRHRQVVRLRLGRCVGPPYRAMGRTGCWGPTVGITQMRCPHGRCPVAPLSPHSLVDAAVIQIWV